MSIDELAQDYRPGEAAKRAVQASNTLLLVGISGAGKDTLQSLLLEKPGYHRIITHTTRPPRRNDGVLERDGIEYHFVSQNDMIELLESKQMIEINKYGSHYYGASVEEFERANQAGDIAIANIDVNGIAAMRRLGDDAVRSLFILPPSYSEWMLRLSRRYPDEQAFRAVFKERRDTAIAELEHALGVPYYHFIINDDLDRAVRVIDEIAHRQDSFNRHDDEARLVARDLLDAIRAHAD